MTTQTNTVIVGQQISMFCELSVPIRTGWTFTNFSWTVPGITFSNYAADALSGVLYTNFPTNHQDVVFYWADGASNRVIQCSATVNGQTVTAKTTFNVLRPTAKIIATGGTVALNQDYYADTTLHCGLPQVGSVGMLFSNTVAAPTGYSGNIYLEWVQKVSSLLRRVQTNDYPAIWYREQATNVLDVSYSYGFDSAYPYPCTTDSPHSLGLSSYQAVSYSDSFDTTRDNEVKEFLLGATPKEIQRFIHRISIDGRPRFFHLARTALEIRLAEDAENTTRRIVHLTWALVGLTAGLFFSP
ncbi:MAG: hypothetical protein ACLP2Y_10595 [Limisphaerales bacterium]